PDSASTARVARSAHHRGVRSAGHQPLSPRRHRHIDQKDRADPANRPLSHHRDQRPAPHPRPRNPQSRPETPPRSRSRWALNSGTSQEELSRWARDHFDIVVVDEFHHAEADTYRRVLDHFVPQNLLGLTATPERADGVDVAAEFFDGRVASELRLWDALGADLWDALGADLLVPFHYFGIADGIDLRGVRFSRGRY